MRLKGRRILVTGAAQGIGRTIAEMFHREGARVAMLDRGKIRFVGTPDEFRKSDDALVRAFLERDAGTGSDRVMEAV